MLSFLWSFYKKHKKLLTSISVLELTLIGTIWSYDIQQLTLTGTLTHQEILRIRSFLTLLAILLYLASLLVTLLYHYKKDVDFYEAKLNPPKTFIEVNQAFINALPDAKQDTIALEDSKHPKSAFDAAYERLMKLSKQK